MRTTLTLNGLSKFSPNHMIFIGGDLNRRIGTQNDLKDLNYLPQDYQLEIIRTAKSNQDTSVNEYRHQLLELWNDTKLRVLNGRVCEDLQRRLTYVGFPGCSAVDLGLVSEAFPTKSTIVLYLSVQGLNFLSDHRPILPNLGGNYKFISNKIINDTQLCKMKDKPTWHTWKNSICNL